MQEQNMEVLKKDKNYLGENIMKTVSSIDELTKELKVTYKNLYDKIMRLDSSCLNIDSSTNTLPLDKLLERMSVDIPDLTNIKVYIQSQDLSRGFLIHDLSGTGLYTLAYYLAKSWSNNEILDDYKALVILPIEQMNFYTLESADTFNIRDFFRVWGIDIGTLTLEHTDILIIASGCSKELRIFPREDTQQKTYKENWVKFSQDFPHIVISSSEELSYLYKTIDNIIKLSLKPFTLHLEHLKDRDNYSDCYITAKSILKEALDTIDQKFFSIQPGQNKGNLKTVEKFREQVNNVLSQGSDFEISDITIEHAYPIITLQNFIRAILDPSQQNFYGPLLSMPQWFGAAMSASKEANKKHYATYRVGGYLLARDLDDDYVACLEPLSETINKPQDKMNKISVTANTNIQFKEMLNNLLQIPDFDQLLETEILQQVKQSAHNSDKSSFFDIFKIRGSIIKDIRDSIPSKYSHSRYDKDEKIDYKKVQERFNSDDIHKVIIARGNINDFIKMILTGQEIQIEIPNLVLGIGAVLIAETHRYRPAFLTTMCLLDLLDYQQDELFKLWQNFFYQSSSTTLLSSYNDIERGIMQSIISTLGGLHPMSQGNSRNQVSSDVQPQYGMHLVDFKSHLILMNWISNILAVEQDITPHLTAEIVDVRPGTSLIDVLSNLDIKLNPQFFDRFSRRLEKFDSMLIKVSPIREIFPHKLNDFKKFFKQYANFIPTLSYGLPDRQHTGLPEAISAYPEMLKILANSMDDVDENPNLARKKLEYILSIDPDFYQLFYFYTHTYLQRDDIASEYECLESIKITNLFLEKAKIYKESGDFYYMGLYLLIVAHNNLIEYKLQKKEVPDYTEFDKIVSEYLAEYTDIEDMDHWRVYALKGIAAMNRGMCYDAAQDFRVYLNNIDHNDQQYPEYLEASKFIQRYDSHYNQELNKYLQSNNPGSYDILFLVSEIYGYLGKHDEMLENGFKALIEISYGRYVYSSDFLNEAQRNFTEIVQKYCSYNKLASPNTEKLYNNILLGKILGFSTLKDTLDYGVSYYYNIEVLARDSDIRSLSITRCDHLRAYKFQKNLSELYEIFCGQEFKIDEERKVIIFFQNTIQYKNKLLNFPALMTTAKKFISTKDFSKLISLGNDEEIAEQILNAINELGVEKVLEIFFCNKIKSSDPEVVKIQEQAILTKTQKDEQLLETIAKIEKVIGKEALAELAGWHQYISKALSNNHLSKHATTVIQTISNIVNNLEEWLDFSAIYEDIDVDSQVAIIVSQLENMFDFVASGITHVGLPPRYPDFDPDDYYGCGSGGGSNGGNGNNGEQAVNNIDFSLLFAGQNLITNNTTFISE